MEETVALEIPPSPEFVGAARLFVGAASRHFGVDETHVADLKIAVSEACTGAITASNGKANGNAPPVRLTVKPLDDVIVVEVIGGAGFGRAPLTEGATDPSILKNGLGLDLIEALFPQVEISEDEDGSGTLRLSLDRSEIPSVDLPEDPFKE